MLFIPFGFKMGRTFTWILTLLAFTASSGSAKESNAIGQLAQFSDTTYLHRALNKILKPRVVGSRGHAEVAAFIKKELEDMNLSTTIDQFTQRVPIFGDLTFTNIIGKFNPDADEFLTLACHYDSKYFPENENFVGAIDSAVPCAIMLDVAKQTLPYLLNLPQRNDIGLMLIFFDGEEAFLNWTNTDSIYGSRHLAEKMFKKKSPGMGRYKSVKDIDRIEVLVLLDLIGAANSSFYSLFSNTRQLHGDLVNIEQNLKKSGLLEPSNDQFRPEFQFYGIDDDHRPFLERNVPVLHLISVPFPKHWHTELDNADNLHWPSIHNFNKVMRIFVYRYIKKHNAEVSFRNYGDKI